MTAASDSNDSWPETSEKAATLITQAIYFSGQEKYEHALREYVGGLERAASNSKDKLEEIKAVIEAMNNGVPVQESPDELYYEQRPLDEESHCWEIFVADEQHMATVYENCDMDSMEWFAKALCDAPNNLQWCVDEIERLEREVDALKAEKQGLADVNTPLWPKEHGVSLQNKACTDAMQCRCGHRHGDHASILSHNVSAGRCKNCDCEYFVIHGMEAPDE